MGSNLLLLRLFLDTMQVNCFLSASRFDNAFGLVPKYLEILENTK
jgi:hypothetical protein